MGTETPWGAVRARLGARAALLLGFAVGAVWRFLSTRIVGA